MSMEGGYKGEPLNYHLQFSNYILIAFSCVCASLLLSWSMV